MAGEPVDVVAQFRQSYDTLVRFPILLAPPLAMSVLGFLLMALIFGGVAGFGALAGWLRDGDEAAFIGGLVGLALGILLFVAAISLAWLLASGMVIFMARDALDGREPEMGRALGDVAARLGAIFWASTLTMAIVGLGFLFLVLPGFVAMVLLMFTLPAVLLDGLPAVPAMKRSVQIVRAHLGPVIGLIVGSLLVLVGVAVAASIAGLIPFLGGLAALVLHFAATSYLTVVGVRFYRALAPAA